MALRTIETDDLKCLKHEGFGPWRLGDDLLLRTSANMRPFQTEAAAKAVFDVYHAVRLAGAPTPDALEIVRVGDGYGVVVEYVSGLPLGTHLMFGSYSAEMAGCAIGSLARKLHEVHVEAGRDWRALFAKQALALSTLMELEAGNRLVSLVEKMPPSDTLIHGDLHVANVVVRNGECHPIDMEAAGFGHPAFELAIARSRMKGAANRLAVNVGVKRDEAERMWRSAWRALLQSYFEGASEAELDDLDRRFEVLAHIETSRHVFANDPGSADGQSDNQKDLIATCIQRIEEVLPRVTRLDF